MCINVLKHIVSSIFFYPTVPKSRRKSFVRRQSESSLTSLDLTDTEEKNTIFYRDLLAVDMRRDGKKGHKEGGGVCIGIKLYTFDEKEGNRMKVRGSVYKFS